MILGICYFILYISHALVIQFLDYALFVTSINNFLHSLVKLSWQFAGDVFYANWDEVLVGATAVRNRCRESMVRLMLWQWLLQMTLVRDCLITFASKFYRKVEELSCDYSFSVEWTSIRPYPSIEQCLLCIFYFLILAGGVFPFPFVFFFFICILWSLMLETNK